MIFCVYSPTNTAAAASSSPSSVIRERIVAPQIQTLTSGFLTDMFSVKKIFDCLIVLVNLFKSRQFFGQTSVNLVGQPSDQSMVNRFAGE